MNSVLQQLYAISEFRSAILECNLPQMKSLVDDGNTESNDQSTHTRGRDENKTSVTKNQEITRLFVVTQRESQHDVFYQTQRAFHDLNDGTGRAFVNPVGFVRAFLARYPAFKRNPQNCAHEFLYLILDQVARHMEAVPAESFTNQPANCIGGVIETVKTCSVCQLQTTISKVPFKGLEVHVRLKETGLPCNTIERFIQEFMKPETLDNNSNVECSNCQKHTKTTLTKTMSKLQQVAF
jgi:uncharacterized UBP type Zn finger protein